MSQNVNAKVEAPKVEEKGMLEIKVTAPKIDDGLPCTKETEIVHTIKVGATLKEILAYCGEEESIKYLTQAIKSAYGNAVRGQMMSGQTVEQIANTMKDWKPGVSIGGGRGSFNPARQVAKVETKEEAEKMLAQLMAAKAALEAKLAQSQVK